MPERLDTITVQTTPGLLPLPWDSRQALLAELRRDEALRPTVVAFEVVRSGVSSAASRGQLTGCVAPGLERRPRRGHTATS